MYFNVHCSRLLGGLAINLNVAEALAELKLHVDKQSVARACCTACGQTKGKLKRCVGACFCSDACQKNAWKVHKQHCRVWAPVYVARLTKDPKPSLILWVSMYRNNEIYSSDVFSAHNNSKRGFYFARTAVTVGNARNLNAALGRTLGSNATIRYNLYQTTSSMSGMDAAHVILCVFKNLSNAKIPHEYVNTLGERRAYASVGLSSTNANSHAIWSFPIKRVVRNVLP